VENLNKIVEKINSLRIKFNELENQIKEFEKKKIDELIIMASEFGINEDFVKVNNIHSHSPYTMSDQDKWLDFMRKN